MTLLDVFDQADMSWLPPHHLASQFARRGLSRSRTTPRKPNSSAGGCGACRSPHAARRSAAAVAQQPVSAAARSQQSRHSRVSARARPECRLLVANNVVSADVVRRNPQVAEAALRPWTPVFIHGDLQIVHVLDDGDEASGVGRVRGRPGQCDV